jgi:hypothetical protein
VATFSTAPRSICLSKKSARRRSDKPGFVPTITRRRRSFIYDGDCSPPPAADPRSARRGASSVGRSRRVPLLGLAPGGVYRAPSHPGHGCALTAPFHPYRRRTEAPRRRYLSVALSLALRPVDVIDRLPLRSPDFPLATEVASDPLLLRLTGCRSCLLNGLLGSDCLDHCHVRGWGKILGSRSLFVLESVHDQSRIIEATRPLSPNDRRAASRDCAPNA